MTRPGLRFARRQHDMTLTFTPTGTANQWASARPSPMPAPSTATIAAGDNIVQFNYRRHARRRRHDLQHRECAVDRLGSDRDRRHLAADLHPSISARTASTNGLSQIGTNFTVGKINQDGVQFGNFSGVSVDTDGVVTANYRQRPASRDLHRCRSRPSRIPTGCSRSAATPTSKPTNPRAAVLLRQPGPAPPARSRRPRWKIRRSISPPNSAT